MKHTISILVNNHAGVLSRISGMFSRRGFNIDSLAVGVTHNPTVSRVTIIVNGDDYMVDQVEKQLGKLVDVRCLKRLQYHERTSRELMLLKINYSAATLGEIMNVAQIISANVLDMSLTTLTLEVCAKSEQMDDLLKIVKPYGIVEVVRTGTIAVQKGAMLLEE